MNRYDPGIRLLTRDALLPEADALLKKSKTIMPCQRRIEWAGSSGEVPRLFVLGGPAPVRPWSSHTIDFHMPSAMPLQPDHGRSITIPAITSTISTARIAATGSNFQAERIGKISKSTSNWQTYVFRNAQGMLREDIDRALWQLHRVEILAQWTRPEAPYGVRFDGAGR